MGVRSPSSKVSSVVGVGRCSGRFKGVADHATDGTTHCTAERSHRAIVVLATAFDIAIGKVQQQQAVLQTEYLIIVSGTPSHADLELRASRVCVLETTGLQFDRAAHDDTPFGE